MRTTLPDTIKTESEAGAFLTDLHNNGEAFHPDDNAHDIIWHTCNPTKHERDKLNDLMGQIAKIPNFDPCSVFVALLIITRTFKFFKACHN